MTKNSFMTKNKHDYGYIDYDNDYDCMSQKSSVAETMLQWRKQY